MSLIEKYPRNNWWTRLSRRRRIIILSVTALVVLAIGLGVGLGVGLNQNGDDNDNNNPGTPTSSGTPTPPSASGTPPSSPATPHGTLSAGDNWQIILEGPLNLAADASAVVPDVPVWDIDLFTNNASTITTLKNLNRTVICYFSAGTYENWRPDASQFDTADLGKDLPDWPGEKWLNLSSPGVRAIMSKRLQMAKDKGCDAVDPDNVDGYDNKNGLGLTRDMSVDYMQFLSTEAKKLGMMTGLKNAGKIVNQVLNFTDFAVNEQCVQYQECDSWSPYISAGKPVFHIEYPKGAPNIAVKLATTDCAESGNGTGAAGFSTVLKKMNLDGFVQYCNGATAQTSVFTSG